MRMKAKRFGVKTLRIEKNVHEKEKRIFEE